MDIPYTQIKAQPLYSQLRPTVSRSKIPPALNAVSTRGLTSGTNISSYTNHRRRKKKE